MRTRLRSLPAFEIAVRRTDDALVLQPVVAHMAAQGATGFVPFETGILEDPVESFRRRLDLGRARDAEALDAGRDLAALKDAGGDAQIADPRIGARADIGDVD